MDDTPLRRLHVDVKRTVDVSEHQQRVNSASTASTTGIRSRCELPTPSCARATVSQQLMLALGVDALGHPKECSV